MTRGEAVGMTRGESLFAPGGVGDTPEDAFAPGVDGSFWMFFVYIRKLNYLLFIILFQYSLLKSGGFGLPYRFLLVSLQVEFITIND